MERHNPPRAFLCLRPLAERRTAQRLHLESVRKHEAQLEQPDPRDRCPQVHVHQQPVVIERQHLPARDAHLRRDRRHGQLDFSPGRTITPRLLQPRERLPLAASRDQPGIEVLHVDHGKFVGANRLRLRIAAERERHHSDLSRRAQRTQRLQGQGKRQLARTPLRLDVEPEHPRLRRLHRDVQAPRFRIETTLTHRPARDFAHQKRFTPFTALWNVTGMPAVSLPLHWSEAPPRLPVGVMLAGRAGDDHLLLALAAQVEDAATVSGRWPHPATAFTAAQA